MRDSVITVQRFLKKSFTENMGLKVIAAGIAILLYALVAVQEETERIFDVEVVEILPAPITALVMSSKLPETVRLRLRGPQSTIMSIERGDIPPVEIDLRDRGEGNTSYYFSDQSFEIPSGTEFVRVTPESIQVRMERLVSRQLPIHVRTFGRLKPGCELIEQPSVSPKRVTVIGPSSTMRTLNFVETEDVSIEAVGVGEHEFIVPARPIDNVSVRQGDELRVSVKTRWTPGKRMISGLLVQTKGTELASESNPKEVAISLSGPQVALDNLDPGKITPVIRFDEENAPRPGIHNSKVDIEGLPENITVTSIVPKRVQIRLTTPRAGASSKKTSAPK